MKTKEAYWDGVIKGYEGSGLSQEDFCREQGIPVAKFKYQWRKRMAKISQKANSEKPIYFETLRISNEESACLEPAASQSIIIRFPNQLSCEVKVAIKSLDFSSLLNQLRKLC